MEKKLRVYLAFMTVIGLAASSFLVSSIFSISSSFADQPQTPDFGLLPQVQIAVNSSAHFAACALPTAEFQFLTLNVTAPNGTVTFSFVSLNTSGNFNETVDGMLCHLYPPIPVNMNTGNWSATAYFQSPQSTVAVSSVIETTEICP